MSANPPVELVEAIRRGRRFLLTSHANPDGDAIGSEAGLARVLAALGKEAVVWNRDRAPSVYAPLPGVAAYHTGPEPPAGFPTAFDAAIVLECPTLDRTGLEARLGELPLLNIDHHLGNAHYGAAHWVEPTAPAVGEMVFRLARALGVTLDPDTATCLYLTLVTDTGGFRFANATPAAFTAAAQLVEVGAQPEKVSQWLFESYPEGMIRLLGAMLGTLELHHGGRLSTALLTQAMFREAGAAPGDSEGLIDYPRSILGVSATALLREKPDGRIKVSLRSRGAIDVERIARAHGGGGHKNAAGFDADGPFAALRELVVAELTGALAEGEN